VESVFVFSTGPVSQRQVMCSVQEWKRQMTAQLAQEKEAFESQLRQQMSKQRDEQIKLVEIVCMCVWLLVCCSQLEALFR
jgi:hypothetical protein